MEHLCLTAVLGRNEEGSACVAVRRESEGEKQMISSSEEDLLVVSQSNGIRGE